MIKEKFTKFDASNIEDLLYHKFGIDDDISYYDIYNFKQYYQEFYDGDSDSGARDIYLCDSDNILHRIEKITDLFDCELPSGFYFFSGRCFDNNCSLYDKGTGKTIFKSRTEVSFYLNFVIDESNNFHHIFGLSDSVADAMMSNANIEQFIFLNKL